MDSIKMARLDLFSVKSSVASIIIVTLFMTALFSFTFDTFLMVGFACAWTTTFYGTLSFQVQESNSLEVLYGSAPLSVKEIVMGRYLSTFILFVGSLLLGVVLFIVVPSIGGAVPQIADIISGVSVALLVYAILAGVTTPTLFRLGYTKGRIISSIPFLAFIGLFFLASYFLGFSSVVETASRLSNYLIPISVIASALILAASYQLSVIAYRKRQ